MPLNNFKVAWAPFIPPRILFFIWKLIHNALPTDLSIKVPLSSRCSCCTNGQLEDNEHLLLRSDLAKAVWQHFASIFEMRSPGNLNVSAYLLELVDGRKESSIEGLFFTLSPIMILWEIWKERNRRRYEEVYRVDNLRQSEAIIIRDKYWIRRISESFKYKSMSSANFLNITSKIGVKPQGPEEKDPRVLRWKGPILGEACLSIDRASQNK